MKVGNNKHKFALNKHRAVTLNPFSNGWSSFNMEFSECECSTLLMTDLFIEKKLAFNPQLISLAVTLPS